MNEYILIILILYICIQKMPNFYCDYCGIYLKHSSPFGRKQHNRGKKHIFNKVEYFKNLLRELDGQP